MYVVGLTGGIGSGKSTVADLFVALGTTLVDTDIIARELTGPNGIAMPALLQHFGQAVINVDGALNRAAMRQLAFSDPAARSVLENIMHPLIRVESDRRCAVAQSPYVILAVPLLVESESFRERCDRIAVVDCLPEVQLARVMARNGLSEVEVRAVISAQTSRENRLAVADDILDNMGAPEVLLSQVDALHQKYLHAASIKLISKC